MDERDANEVGQHPEREAGPHLHARAALVRPLHGHDRDRVPALARQEEDLGVEDDAVDLLAREQIERNLAPEALKATLRVGHWPSDPERGKRVEELSEQLTVERELRARIKEAFEGAGIEIPFQQRTVWHRLGDNPAAILAMASPDTGAAPQE